MPCSVVLNPYAVGSGIPATSLSFTGASSQYLSTSSANWGAYDRTQFSIIFAFYNKAGTSNPIICGKGNSSSTAEWAVRFLTSGGRMEITLHNGTFNAGSEFTIPSYADDTWFAIKIDYNGNEATVADRVSVSVNNSPVSVTVHTSTPANVPTRTGDATVGAWANPTAYFDGDLHQFAFVSGSNPADSDVFADSSGKLKNLAGLTDLWSYITAETDATTDEVLSSAWTNNNTVTTVESAP